MYEKELTVTSSSGFLNSQQQQQKSRIEALEKAVEGYRELFEKFEADVGKTVKGSGKHIQCVPLAGSPGKWWFTKRTKVQYICMSYL
jgi:hypothetical protein